MKLGRRVVATEMQVDFEDGCGTPTQDSTAIYTFGVAAGVIPA